MPCTAKVWGLELLLQNGKQRRVLQTHLPPILRDPRFRPVFEEHRGREARLRDLQRRGEILSAIEGEPLPELHFEELLSAASSLFCLQTLVEGHRSPHPSLGPLSKALLGDPDPEVEHQIAELEQELVEERARRLAGAFDGVLVGA
ncbi:hypothetical protein EVJ50_03870 [Synechococcus sp. RSCCF101]|uniref:hypothetical protein n=1 Tax=Synechococcus sp. RSCCF101 TaxID=2511069 RepID=UPI001243FA22|nr:hypothetical protein [Synechococcus sp. RSCCF101]QEY31514.1 hypothetical protein EVJ50_03870 [Synechococcus sp. RSCCF101]